MQRHTHTQLPFYLNCVSFVFFVASLEFLSISIVITKLNLVTQSLNNDQTKFTFYSSFVRIIFCGAKTFNFDFTIVSVCMSNIFRSIDYFFLPLQMPTHKLVEEMQLNELLFIFVFMIFLDKARPHHFVFDISLTQMKRKAKGKKISPSNPSNVGAELRYCTHGLTCVSCPHHVILCTKYTYDFVTGQDIHETRHTRNRIEKERKKSPAIFSY